MFALFAMLICFTACQKEAVEPTTVIIDGQEVSQSELDAVKAENARIMSYGDATYEAYQDFNNGGTIGYYSPLGVLESVDFEWDEYEAVMEHSKIMQVLEDNGMIDLYTDIYPTGTYLKRSQVESLTPEILPLIDQATANKAASGCEVLYVGPWNPCGSCQLVGQCWGCEGGGTLTFYYQREYCRHISTSCSCYTQKKRSGC